MISILLPVHNGASFLTQTLESLRRQSEPRWELIAVDNGSTDATGTILRSAAKSDVRIKAIRLPQKDLLTALKTALAAARGTHVARMDADDICHPRRLEKQRAFLQSHPGVQVLTARTKFLGDKMTAAGFSKYQCWTNRWLTHNEMVSGMWKELPYANPTLFMRRDDLVRVGGYNNIGHPEDYSLAFRFLAAGYRFHKLPEKLLTWRDHPARASRTLPEIRNQRFFKLKAEFFLRLYPNFRDRIVLWGAGKNGKALARAFAAAGAPASSFVDGNPGRWGQTIESLPVVRPLRKNIAKDACVILAVAQRGAAPEIRRKMRGWGMISGKKVFEFC